MAIYLGNKKGHWTGENVVGTHTTVIETADEVGRELASYAWMKTVLPGIIKPITGGRLSVKLKREIGEVHKNVITLIFTQSGTVQEIGIGVEEFDKNAETIIGNIKEAVAVILEGADFYDDITGQREKKSGKRRETEGSWQSRQWKKEVKEIRSERKKDLTFGEKNPWMDDDEELEKRLKKKREEAKQRPGLLGALLEEALQPKKKK